MNSCQIGIPVATTKEADGRHRYCANTRLGPDRVPEPPDREHSRWEQFVLAMSRVLLPSNDWAG